MNGYVQDTLYFYHCTPPKKIQLSPHKHTYISYGYSVQYAMKANSIPPLNLLVIKLFQFIVFVLLYYSWSVDNKLPVALGAIGSHQSSATERTSAAITQLLNYIATYPNYIITYCASSLVLAGKFVVSFLNEIKSRRWSGDNIFLSEDVPIPSNNGPLLNISQIVKFVKSSAVEAELAALVVVTKHMVPLHQTLIKMGFPQP